MKVEVRLCFDKDNNSWVYVNGVLALGYPKLDEADVVLSKNSVAFVPELQDSTNTDEYYYGPVSMIQSATNNAMKLVDIEKTIGIDPFIPVFALKYGVYRKSAKGDIVYSQVMGINESFVLYYDNNPDDFSGLAYEAYGKTWALTKEELE